MPHKIKITAGGTTLFVADVGGLYTSDESKAAIFPVAPLRALESIRDDMDCLPFFDGNPSDECEEPTAAIHGITNIEFIHI